MGTTRVAPNGQKIQGQGTDHILGLSQRSRGRPAAVSPREPRYCSTAAPFGSRRAMALDHPQAARTPFRRFRTFILTDDAVPLQLGRTFVGQRMLPFCPMATVPGCGQYVSPCGLAPVAMMVMSSPLAVSITDT